jgi:transcriptional regulator with XRE-family HTH domain
MDIEKLNLAIGAEVREARISKGYGRAKMAQLSGLSASTIQRIENGERPADINQMAKICEALDEDIPELIDRALIAIGE